MEGHQVSQLLVDDRELFSDEFFEHEDVLVFVDVVKAVDVWTEGPAELPAACAWQALQAVVVLVQVL